MSETQPHLSRGVRNGYLSARGISAGLAMSFALFYSSNLGVERRSLVAFIMTTALIASVICTSGVSLTYRRAVPNMENRLTLNAYLYLATLLSVFAAFVTFLSVLIYSQIKISIPNTLLFVTLIYAFFASLDFCFHQALIAHNLFKVASILDVLTISMQISIYLFLIFVNQVSIAVSLFAALIISYITSTVTALLLLIGIKEPSIRLSRPEIKLLLSESKNYHLYGISNGFADRIDRIVIAWFLPLGLLGKYAVSTSIISFLRFLPEALSRLIVGKQSLPQIAKLSKSGTKKLIVTSAIALLGAGLSQLFVKVVFGDDWLLPFLVLLLFALQEIFRGYYQVSLSKLVAIGKDKQVKNLSLGLIVATLAFSILGSQLFGIYGVPLGMALSYFFLIFFLKRSSA